MPSVFEARCRLPISATTSTTCGLPNRSSRVSQGRRPQPPSVSSTCQALSFSRDSFCRSVDTRRAALRPFEPTPVSVPPACAGLPDRDAGPSASPPPTCATLVVPSGSSVRIDEHESKDRAKDSSPDRKRRTKVPLRRVHTHAERMPMTFPSSVALRTSVVTGAWDSREEP
jgi:hypothetical protein